MKKLYENNHGWDLYCALILEKGDKVKRYWLDCVLSMDEIHKYREQGVDSFVAILRENGAELFPVGIPCNKERFRYYAKNEPESSVYVLNYKTSTIWGAEVWGEADELLTQDEGGN